MAMPPKTDKSSLVAEELEGGFFQTHPGVYVGTVRRRDDKSVVWKCSHPHSRPEYNARYNLDKRRIWELSALNCGRQAHDEWPKPQGSFGMVSNDWLSVEDRDDSRIATVGKRQYVGIVKLTTKGRRILTVGEYDPSVTKTDPVPGTPGHIDLDRPMSKAVTRPVETYGEYLEAWATAAWLLKGCIWGVVFQDPQSPLHLDKPREESVKEMLGSDFYGPVSRNKASGLDLPTDEFKKREVAPPAPAPSRGKPHIRVVHDGPKRSFEVVDGDGNVLAVHSQRGRAAEDLHKAMR